MNGGDDGGRARDVARLRNEAPRNWFLRGSVALVLVLVVCAWAFGGFEWGDALAPRRVANLSRFLHDVVPYPARTADRQHETLGGWTTDLRGRRG
jgi:hypothetical protein